jgi:hypothetical protein
MDVEERVRALEDLSLRSSSKVLALELAIRAMISAHPDRSSAKASFDRLCSELLHRVSDLGFDDGRLASDTAKQTTLLEKELTALRGCF